MQNVIYFVKKLYKYLRSTLRVFRGLKFEPIAVIGEIGSFLSGIILHEYVLMVLVHL